MKVAILAGGKGTRLGLETYQRPKPMVEIGGRPILWHIIRYYAHYGFRDFAVALGYKGEMISQYFGDRSVWRTPGRPGPSPVTSNSDSLEDIRVETVDTGELTNTGGRIKRLAPALGGETFMLTWGDGLSNVDLDCLLAFHRGHGRLATVTAVHPPSRFGMLDIDKDARVRSFVEKPTDNQTWINGAFFVLEPGVFDYIEGDDTQFEKQPLEQLAKNDQLMAFKHESFWQCMDNVAEKHLLEGLWQSGIAPWKVWE
jgi:glucose-1-phosphate cytidylyltransferase